MYNVKPILNRYLSFSFIRAFCCIEQIHNDELGTLKKSFNTFSFMYRQLTSKVTLLFGSVLFCWL